MVLSIRKPANWRIANQPVFLPLSIFYFIRCSVGSEMCIRDRRMKQQNRQQRKFRRMRQFSDHGGRDQQPNQIKNFGKNAIAKRLGLNTGLLRKMKNQRHTGHRKRPG